MKYFYALIVVLAFIVVDVSAQTWIGPSGGNWSTPANWSGGSVPNSNAANVVFNSAANVNLDISVTVRSLSVSGGGTVRIDGGEVINEISLSSGSGSPTISVAASTTLELYQLGMSLANNIQGTINGSLVLDGTTEADYAELIFPDLSGQPATFEINGSLIDEYGSSILAPIDDYLKFNSGSTYHLKGDKPIVARALYHSNSEIIISGVRETAVQFEETASIGSLTYDCPNQNEEAFLATIGIPSGLVIQGNLNIQHSNNLSLELFNNELGGGANIYSLTINGDFNISGNSYVVLSNAFDNLESYYVQVNGSFNMSGGVFSLQNSNSPDLQPTTLFVKGNIDHTGGTITANSIQTSTSTSLFNIEMNGSTAQTISSSTKVFNNANNQVALHISNPAGVTLLSELKVGKLGFSNNGILFTSEPGGRFIEVLNPSAAAVWGNGYVDGPVRRATNSTDEYLFPTGNAGVSRSVSVYPSATDASIYQAYYVNASPSNSNVASPLSNIVNYYWEVDRIGSGANAQVEITLPGAISGATAADALVVAKSSGGLNWERAKGDAGNFFPGDQTSGKLISDIQTSFSSFTIGWGSMDAVLPITLLSFTANKVSTSVARLNWNITENSTPEMFEVMKSTDGRNFVKIASVPGLTAKLSYDFTDNNLNSGNNYYRLRMVDKDGSVSFSSIIVVMNGTQGTLITSMIPTVVTDRARLNISAAAKGNLQLVITDINGRIIQTQVAAINPGNQEVWINASRLSSGYFQITGYINGERTQTIRFLKR